MQSGALATVLPKELSAIMPELDFHVNNPQQLTLTDDAVFEVILRVGIIPSSDHAQFQFEVIDSLTGQPLEIRARHHVSCSEVPTELSDWVQLLREKLWELTGPF